MNDYNNLSHIKLFGISIPEQGQLATVEYQEEIKRLIRSVKSVEEVELGDEINHDGNKIILYLIDGNKTEITGSGQSKVLIAQIINGVTYKAIVIQPELRALLDSPSLKAYYRCYIVLKAILRIGLFLQCEVHSWIPISSFQSFYIKFRYNFLLR